MENIYVAGIAMTVFGRHPERSLHDLAGEALQGALQDAGCAASDLGVAYYSGMTNGPLQGQISIPGQVVFSKIGIEGIPRLQRRECLRFRQLWLQPRGTEPEGRYHGRGAGPRRREDEHSRQDESIRNFRGRLGRFAGRRELPDAGEDGRRYRAAPGLRVRQAVQQVHGHLRGHVPLAHEDLRHHAATDRGGVRQESPALRAQPVLAVPQAFHDRRSARGTADHLPDHAADVRAAVRWRRCRHPVYRKRPAAHRRRQEPLHQGGGQRHPQLHPSPHGRTREEHWPAGCTAGL